MNTALPLLALLAVAGCAAAPSPLNNLSSQSYAARGAEPFWALAIGGDSIALTTAEGGTQFERALPTEADGVTRWHSGDGTKVITIEAIDENCRLPHDPRTYPDRVTVSLSGRQLQGCGGRAASR